MDNSSCSASYKLVENNELGRHWVADRDIPAGVVIFREKALIQGPLLREEDYKNSIIICFGCNRKLNKKITKRCSKCWYPVCGVECEKLECHAEYECPIFSKKSPWLSIDLCVAEYESICILRGFLYNSKQPSRQKRCNELMILQSEQTLPISTVDLSFGQYRCNLGRKQFGLMDKIGSSSEWMKIFKIIKLNAFSTYGEHTDYSSQYIFFKGSFFAHSCLANCEYSISPETSEFQIFTSVHITKGTPLTVNYISGQKRFGFMATMERNQLIRARGFICSCARCQDPEECGSNFSTLRCTNCKEATLVPVKEEEQLVWKCRNDGCSVFMDWFDVDKMMINVEEMCHLKETTKEKMECIEQASKTLMHRNFSTIVTLKFQLWEELRDKEPWQICGQDWNYYVRLTEELMDAYDYICPGLSEMRVNLLKVYCESVLERELEDMLDDTVFCTLENRTVIINLMDKLDKYWTEILQYQSLSIDLPVHLKQNCVDTISNKISHIAGYRIAIESVE